jgi:hypothetical protein
MVIVHVINIDIMQTKRCHMNHSAPGYKINVTASRGFPRIIISYTGDLHTVVRGPCEEIRRIQ